MAVTILDWPKGHIINPTGITGVSYDFGGFFQIDTSPEAHGLVTGDVFYVESTIENYNGFFKVGAYNAVQIQVLNLDGTNDGLEFLQIVDVTIYASILTHGWSCVHLPITYKLTNTRWPTNSVDTAQAILTLSDDLGYARVTLSGSLGTFEDLSFVKISNAANSDFDGVYQILDKLSTSNITLNAAYNTFNGSGLLGAAIQLYYGNYNVVVRVYAGINSSHEWTAQKPYELAATLELIPDADNEVQFSINEILKAYIKSVNNLLLGTMPNNIDAWTNFYIEYAEQYDTSNGYTVSTELSSFTSDLSTFEGTAVNAILPFKNIHSGSLSEYLMTNNAALFLTLFVTPVLFSCGDDTPDCYSDISFLNPFNNTNIIIVKQFYFNGVLQATTEIDLGVIDSGVIRAELSADCNYDRVDIHIDRFQDPAGGELQNGAFELTLSPSTSVGSGNAWTWTGAFSGAAQATLPSSLSPTQRLRMPFLSEAGVTYEFELTTRANDGGGGAGNYTDWKLYLTDGVDFSNVVSSLNKPLGTTIFTVTITPTSDMPYIEITAESNNVAGQDRDVLVLLIDNISDPIDETVSETKQIDIDCGCADQEVRLTWLNYLGGFDYWVFNTETGKAIDILNATETSKNIFPEWPKSYGENADTIRKQVSRESTNRLFFTTQYLTEDQADAVAYIKTSPLVQIINSKSDRRTIIVDTDSFTKYTDNQKLITISFSARYTDNIGSQKV